MLVSTENFLIMRGLTKNTKYLTTVSLLIALSVILARFLSLRISIGGVEGIRIGFSDFPLILTGILFGSWWGASAGITADIVGYFLKSYGTLYAPFHSYFWTERFLTWHIILYMSLKNLKILYP